MTTKIIVVRHGETEWNKKKILQGHLDSPLTQEGVEQAKQLAQKFKNYELHKIFSSDLLRAKRTAEFIAAEHNLEVETSKLLREKTFGTYEGWSADDFFKQFENEIHKRDIMKYEERLKFKLAGVVESDEEVINRFMKFAGKVTEKHSGKKLLLVSHGGIMRRLLIYLGWGTYQELPADSIENLGYFTLVKENKFKVEEVFGVNKV